MDNSKIIAYKGIANCFGIGIIDIEYGINDSVKYAIIVNDTMQKEHKAKIRYNLKDEPYFIDYNGHRQYIDEFIRI